MKRLKKFTSMLLLSAFVFNEFAPLIQAAEMLTENNEVIESVQSNFEATGNIEIETHFVLPMRNRKSADVTFKLFDSNNNFIEVSLNDVASTADGYFVKTDKLGSNENVKISATKRRKTGKTEDILAGENASENIVYFALNINNLKKDTYKLEFSGKNFVTYSTNVTLNDYSKRVNITNEKGMFAIGDVNGDNLINDDDINIMFNAIKNNNKEYDLNLDDKVDIADLNYVTANKNSEEKKPSITNTSAILNSNNISFNVGESIVESGDLNNIFKDTETAVTLKQNGEDPIEVTLNLAGNDNEEEVLMSEVRVNFGSNAENMPKGAMLRIETSTGEIKELPIIESTNNENDDNSVVPFTEEEVEGTKVISLGGEVAVKKVTIVITETGSNNLADIAKVEFLNNVKVETKAPADLSKPKYVEIDNSVSEQLTVSFQNVPNVTGYEINIVGPKINSRFQTTFTSFTIEDLDNYKEYKIKVRSVNGEWYSPWTDEYTAIPETRNVPPAVDMVNATPTIGGIDFSWKDMMDTQSYKLYYRIRGTEKWTALEVSTNKYNLRGLESGVEYEAYITGVNKNGEGSPSQTVIAKTLELKPTIYPKYNLINTYNSETGKTDHIKSVSYKMGKSYIKVGEELTSGNEWTMVDDNPESYWEFEQWQMNSYTKTMDAPLFILDQKYTMNEFVITVPDSYKYSYKSSNPNDALVHYWTDEKDISANSRITVQAKIEAKKDENNRVYYVLKLAEPIETSALQIGLTVTGNGPSVQIAELKFYNYDSLVDDVADLFVDDLRVELKSDVTIEKIKELKERADHKNNGEYNPYRESVLNDLEYAEKILNDKNLNKDIITLNPNISNFYNSHLKFAMTISDYQPLGIAVRGGEQINVYVGSTTGKVNAELVFTQNYAEASTWNSKYTLKPGQNIIDVPKIGSASAERGGSVYVRYTSKPDANNTIKIRVSGGTKIPVLDTSLLTSATEKKEAIKNYINDLKDYVGKLNNMYSEYYQGKEYPLAYDKETSALGVTEIVTKHGLWSFSAEAVRDAITTGLDSIDQQVDRLYESTESFDEMMEMFYRHKGLKELTSEEATTESYNAIPKARINIRYMRMFAGAFMYAGGYHIGIEYGSIPGVIQGSKNNGYFGWGISHEIGHQINQSDLVHAEVTNNVYALLAQTANDTSHSRLEDSKIYDKIYEKVTSHTLGKSQNVFVTLGMYWQLHLAYDKNKTFNDTDSIFSKINVLTRTYKNDKKYNKDELLILFASLAAKKNLTNYFEIWGIKPRDEMKDDLQTELKDLEVETKAIYYLNDEARRYILNNGTGISASTKLTASISDTDQKEKRVTINFNVSGESEKILGYEILRNGESIAFVSGDKNSYTDNVGTVNNRAFTYDVVAYDYLLNTIKLDKKLDEVKISHDGSIKKDTFSIESNFKSAKDKFDIEDADMDYSLLDVNKLIDGKVDTAFVGTERITNLNIGDKITSSIDDGNAYIIISLNTKMSLSGIKYTALVENDVLDSNSIQKYKIYVSSDKENWIEARSDTFNIDATNPSEIVYFMKEGTTSKSQLWTYNDVSYIKIEAIDNTKGISGAEIDLLANPGDNVDFKFVNDELNVGILEKDYCYLTDGCSKDSDEGKIKAGTVVFEGSYRGNPAFNTALLVDAKNNNIYYKGTFMAFAELEEDKSVFDVATGTWLFTMTKEEYDRMVKESGEIRAVLYRVNDAETNDGQRITSTSTAVKLPEKLGFINIES